MILYVTELAVNLAEPEDLKRYSVQLADSELSTEEMLSLHNELVQINPTEVAISPETLRTLAGDLAQNSSWQSDFEDMMDYAIKKGWVTNAGEIVGHIETS